MIRLFISYSHKDEAFREELETHLSLLKRQNVIDVWQDRKITAGSEWANQIDENLEAADLILLLISSDFLDSDYCYDIEMKRVLEKHEQGLVRVIPIIIRDCDWAHSPFAKFQALPKNAQPIKSARDLDTAWADVAKGIRLMINELNIQPSERFSAGQPQKVEIPFVIFAMTKVEVEELITKTIFDSPYTSLADRQVFEELIEILKQHGQMDISGYYGETSEEWQPSFSQESTLREKIVLAVSGLNKRNLYETRVPQIIPRFVSSDFFSDEIQLRNHTWSKLSEGGCVFVVDALSLFHPILRRKLLQSGFHSNNRISLIVVYPIGSGDLPINTFLEQSFFAREMGRAFNRFENDLDLLCEFGICDTRRLTRWILAALPDIALTVQGQIPNRILTNAFRATMEEKESTRSRGIESLIYNESRQ